MTTPGGRAPLLGELIADAFENAGRYSTDPREVARLATEALDRLFRGTSGRGQVRLGIPSGPTPA